MGRNRKKLVQTFLVLHIAVLIYSMSTLCGKLATGYQVLSPSFVFWFAAEIFLMGVYALIWQQVIKILDLSIAYPNKSLALVWTLIFSVVFLEEQVTPGKIIGILLVLVGAILMNMEQKSGQEKKIDENQLQYKERESL